MQGSKDVAEQLMASERSYRSVVDNSPNCLQLLDREGRCLAINPKGLEKIGRSEAEMLGRPFLDVWPPETRPIVAAAFAKALQGQQTEFEANYFRPDGRAIIWHVVLTPIPDRQGQTHRVVELAMDITDHRRAEAELRRAKEAAEAATQAKTEFLANTSHEIRTPITAVLGYADLLMEPQLSEEDRSNHLHTIRRNGEMLLALIDDILDISKIEAGKLDVERIPSSPWQILADVATLMRGRADRKDLSLSVESEGPLPESILTDPTRLRQILVNLVGNAVKFTETGQVRVVTRLLHAERPRAPAGVRRHRHRHRHDARSARRDLPPLHPSRLLDQSPLRRHRSGSDHQQAPGDDAWRRHYRHQRVGSREQFPPDHRSPDRWPACRSLSIRPWSWRAMPSRRRASL